MNSDSLYDDFNQDPSTCNSLTDPRVSVHLSKDPVLPQHITEESFAKSQEWLCDLILSFNFFEEVEAKLIAEFCGPDLKKFSMTKVDKIYRFYNPILHLHICFALTSFHVSPSFFQKVK